MSTIAIGDIHGNLAALTDLLDQIQGELRPADTVVFLGDYLVYGHWNNPCLNAEGWPEPRIAGQTIGIDTIAHGVLTAIRLPDRRVFQSRRYGAV